MYKTHQVLYLRVSSTSFFYLLKRLTTFSRTTEIPISYKEENSVSLTLEMTIRLLQAAALSGLLLSTHAFRLTFYLDGSTCGGTVLGEFVGGEGQGCRQDFV